MSKLSGGSRCAYKGCKSAGKLKQPNISFFCFPKDAERCRQWIQGCNRPDLHDKSIHTLYNYYRVCSKHFRNNMFLNDLKNRLQPTAYPADWEKCLVPLQQKRKADDVLHSNTPTISIPFTTQNGKMVRKKSKTYKYCIVPMCNNTSHSATNKLFFYVPKHNLIRDEWCRVMRRPALSGRTVRYCCEDHFNLEDDVANYMEHKIMNVTPRLKSGVVPTKFPSQNRPDPPSPLGEHTKRKRIDEMHMPLPVPFDEKIKTEKEEQLDNSAASSGEVWDYKYRNEMVASDEIKIEFFAEDTVVTYSNDDASTDHIDVGLIHVKNEFLAEDTVITYSNDDTITDQTDVGLIHVKNEPCDVEEQPDNSARSSNEVLDYKLINVKDEIEIKIEFSAEDTEVTYGEIDNGNTDETDTGLIEVKTEPWDDTIGIENKDQLEIKKPELDISSLSCRNEFEQSSNLKKNHTGRIRYKCGLCYNLFFENSDFERHMKLHTEKTQYKCDICGKIFAQSHNLEKHIRLHKALGCIRLHKKPYKCDICEKIFRHSHNLARHCKLHMGDKPFKCDICEKEFALSYYLTNHMKLHEEDKPYKCDICEKRFTQNHSLENHIRTHTGDRPYKCDDCEETFSQYNYLTSHISRRHSGEKPHKCEICEKRFSIKGYLTQHRKTHLEKKQFKCDLCKNKFTQSDYLAHVRQPKEKIPFECDICKEKFTRCNHLVKHITLHIRGVSNNTTQIADIQ